MISSSKKDVQVIIDDKVITLSADESVEYMQKVALYINNKKAEMRMGEFYNRLSEDQKSLSLTLNIADDYFKAKDKVDKLEEEIKKLEKQNYDIQHEQIETKIKYDSALKMQEEYKHQLMDTQARVLELEAIKGSKTKEKSSLSTKDPAKK
ncbi:MAG: cell division protein ZapA [Lachnospiraceae bacterium]|nr:cell division protein ZapA [Lachnospiraceae bacterium]